MKKYNCLFAIAAILLGTACSKEANVASPKVDEGMSAVAPEDNQDENVDPQAGQEEKEMVTLCFGVDTKTVLDGTTVKWCDGDQIQVNGTTCDLVLSGDKTSATVTVEKADSYAAFYPAEWVTAFDGSVYTFAVPATQDGFVSDGSRDGASFVGDANPMYAYSTDTDLTFHHLFGVLQLQLTSSAGEQIFGRMELRANADATALSGAGFTVTPSSGSMTAPGAAAAVSLTGIWSVSDWGDRIYTFVVPARTYSGGVTFDLYDNGAPQKLIRTYEMTGDLTIAAASTKYLPSIDISNYTKRVRYNARKGEDWLGQVNVVSDLDLSDVDELVVETTDPVRLNATDLAAVASAVSGAGRAITVTLSNAKMASDVYGKRILPNCFAGNTKVGKIYLSANLGELAGGAFAGCSAMTELKFEGNLSWIGDNAFDGCTSLSRIFGFRATPPDSNDSALFEDLPDNGTLTCSNASNYNAHGRWSVLASSKGWTINQ